MEQKNRNRVTCLTVLGAIASIIALLIMIYNDNTKQPKDIGSEDTLLKIKRERRLRVGYISYYDITSREAQSGQVKGFLVDLLYKIAIDLNVPKENIEFLETDWQNFGVGLSSGKYDLSIAGTFKTPERQRIVSFTDPIFYLGNGALVRKDDNRFKKIEDFNREDVTVAVVLGEQGYEYATKHLKKAKHKIMPGPDLSLACLEVKKGLVDAALSDQYIIKRYVERHPTVKDALAKNPYYTLPICWAVRHNDKSWLKYLNIQISLLKKSGWLKSIRSNYSMIPWAPHPKDEFEGPITPPPNVIPKYLTAFFSGILYTISISFFSILMGTSLGALLALILASSKKTSAIKILRFFVYIYVYSFLAIPALVLIIILYYNNQLSNLNSAAAATIALALNLSPFVAKIIASGIKNIPENYLIAAKAFGFNDRQIALKFKFPLVIRSSMQTLLVQWFTTIKLSSLASVIGVTEILHRSQQVIRETYQTEQAYVILVICYMIIVIPISFIADNYERIIKIRISS